MYLKTIKHENISGKGGLWSSLVDRLSVENKDFGTLEAASRVRVVLAGGMTLGQLPSYASWMEVVIAIFWDLKVTWQLSLPNNNLSYMVTSSLWGRGGGGETRGDWAETMVVKSLGHDQSGSCIRFCGLLLWFTCVVLGSGSKTFIRFSNVSQDPRKVKELPSWE